MSTGRIHVANQGQHIIPLNVAQDMHCWAFIAENIFTENILQYDPSGINNVAAVFEWALTFTRVGLDRTNHIKFLLAWHRRCWGSVTGKILQDDPCGIDNVITIFGGAMEFTRAGIERTNV
jgi:hypothetical protein